MTKIVPLIRFQAKLFRPAEGGAWMFLRLPAAASSQLPSRSMVSVEGTINGFPFAATLQPDGEGGHWLKVEPDLCEGAKAKSGEMVELEIRPAAVEPEPDVPADLQEALAANPASLAGWSSTTALARRDWIQWLTTGKKAETRLIRLEKMMDMLSKGKRRICCFDRSGMYNKTLSCPMAEEEPTPSR